MNTLTQRVSWSFTWDRIRKPGKRTGNHFFSSSEAERVFDEKRAAGLNPSPIQKKLMEWL